MIRPIVVFETDADLVIIADGGYLWHWYEPLPGEEFIPEEGATEYFERCGKDAIAECIRTGVAYRYGHYEPWR